MAPERIQRGEGFHTRHAIRPIRILDAMKVRLASTLSAAVLLLPTSNLSAADYEKDFDYTPGAVAVDAVIVRPLCLGATVVGTSLFVATLPITAIARSVDKSARALMGVPAHHTF